MKSETAPNNHAHDLQDDAGCRPVDLQLDRRTGLKIRWADGRESVFPLDYLRKQCPCATCRTEREQTKAAATGRSLTILPKGVERATEVKDASLVGNYALQIVWGDGHSTGIYDFRYLRSIEPR
jgi:DUF971 family protein